jgi:hypothetical protein
LAEAYPTKGLVLTQPVGGGATAAATSVSKFSVVGKLLIVAWSEEVKKGPERKREMNEARKNLLEMALFTRTSAYGRDFGHSSTKRNTTLPLYTSIYVVIRALSRKTEDITFKMGNK